MRRLKTKRKHAVRADFPVSPELREAFRRYVDSEPQQPASAWLEFLRLADLLEEAGAPVQPLLAGCCCHHPRQGGISMSEAVAIYRRLLAARS